MSAADAAVTPDTSIVPTSPVHTQISEPGPIVIPAAELGQILAWWEKVQAVKRALVDPAEDVIPIQGKPFTKKSGWRKLGFAYNLTDEIAKEEREKDGNRTIWRMHVKVTAPNGRSVIGVASAASDEKRFAHADHDVYALCHTRAKNRAISDILGLGEVSFEEMTSGEPAKTPGENSANEGSSVEALDGLPWKPMAKNPGGSWVYSDLAEASSFVEALTKAPNKTLTVGAYTYTISGQGGKFVNRFPHKGEG